jgi:peptidoglycan/LPS O-acetylase OafA/YrhL
MLAAGVHLGDLSYPLYAVHWPIVAAVTFLGWRVSASVPAILATAALAAITAATFAIRYDRWARGWLKAREAILAA